MILCFIKSQLISNRYPILSDVVSPTENLQVVPVRDQFLDVFVDLLWLLTLPSPLAENYVTLHALLVLRCVSLQ